MRVRLKGLSKIPMTLANGERVDYYYAWRGGPRLKGEPGSPEFIQRYNEAIAKRRTPPVGLVFSLIAEFKTSSEFTKGAPATQRGYLRYLKMIEAEFGDMPLEALAEPEVRGIFKTWRDTMAATPRTADYAWTTLARVLSVAKDRGRIPVNPCERGGRLYESDRSEKIWGEAEIARVLSCAAPHMELPLMLALWTGQRQGDLLRLSWSAYDGQHICLCQSKGGRRVKIPVSPYLKAAIERTPRAAVTMLANSRGRSWTGDGFRASWRDLCQRANIEGLTFHDIRGSAVVRMALSGATVPEIATFTGHSLKDVEAILDVHYLGRDVKLAESAVRKLTRQERKRTKSAK